MQKPGNHIMLFSIQRKNEILGEEYYYFKMFIPKAFRLVLNRIRNSCNVTILRIITVIKERKVTRKPTMIDGKILERAKAREI